MNKHQEKFLAIFIIGAFFAAGCATTHARRAETPDATVQAKDLQEQIQAKDQQIQDLQAQLDSSKQSLGNNFSGGGSSDKSSIIHVSGVSAMDLQKALSRAGFDPGPIDGRTGKKTKSAVKAFQRKNHLKADGVVGEKTWELLKA